MPRTVAIGIQDFAHIRERNLFYIDKSNFIKEWWEREDGVTLIARPRRFGKTLNLNMLDYFFSNLYTYVVSYFATIIFIILPERRKFLHAGKF